MITKNLDVIPGLCTHCTACKEICPVGAISLKLTKYKMPFPVINSDLCIRCMLCHKICPVEIEQTDHYLSQYQKTNQSVLGEYLECFDMASSDSLLRYKSSSAGVIRTLLKHSLEQRMTDAILCVTENDDNCMDPCFSLIRSNEQMERVANSKYGPVRFAGELKKLLDDTSINKAIVVGLPCHIRAIEKIIRHDPQAKRKDFTKIALFCKKTKDIRYTYFINRRLGGNDKSLQDVKKIQYRGDGWPGKMIFFEKNTVRTSPSQRPDIYNFAWGWSFFSPQSCMFCYDAFGRGSDISVGDPWLPDYLNNTEYSSGASFVVVRTIKGMNMINSAFEALKKRKVDADDVIKSQSRKAIIEKPFFAISQQRILSFFSNAYKFPSAQRSRGIFSAVWFLFWKIFFEKIFDNNLVKKVPMVVFRLLSHLPPFPQRIKKVCNADVKE